MADRLAKISERDRVLIACEIHNGFLQKAIAAKMHLEAHRRLLDRNVQSDGLGPRQLRGRLDELLLKSATLLEESIAEARGLMADLHVSKGLDGGLIPAIEEFASELQNDWGLEIKVHCNGHVATLEAALEHAAYRIIQECLRNACRHSKSQTAEVTVTMNSRFLGLEIRDSGIGFCPDSIPPGHFGLQGIRHHVESLGGRLEIASAPGSGTHVYVVLPVDSI